MFKRLLQLFAPFYEIAKELSIIRQLYEAELAEREHPIVRITEPAGDDTEVSFTGEERKPKSRMQKMFEGIEEEMDD